MSQTATQNQRLSTADSLLDVELRKVFKIFHGETAVCGIDLAVQRGEFFSILGPSGCGKTTTLRLIAGFEMPSAGEVLICQQSMINTPAYRRPVNTVFQSYALFNHLTVQENIAFGLRIKKCRRGEIRLRVQEALRLVKMEAYAGRYPSQLSGGQQQRVALARALVNRPAVVLLDEPLAALDFKLRKEMQVELSNLQRQLGVTFIMVTHDQEEALSLSDRIAVMNEGRIEQIGSPTEIYERPQTPFVADFIGDTNLLKGRVATVDSTLLQVETETGLQVAASPGELETQGVALPVMVSVRPEKIQISPYSPNAQANCFEGRLKHVMYLGTHVQCLVELRSGDRLTILQPNNSSLPAYDSTVYVYWAASDCLVLAA